MATQIKDGLHFFPTSFPGSAYLSNAFTIISSLYILQSVKRPKYLFPPSIKICNVFLVKEIKLFYEFKIPATDFTMFLVLLYFFIFMIHPCLTFCYNLRRKTKRKVNLGYLGAGYENGFMIDIDQRLMSIN